ncbi:MAG: IS256 family transposase [Deltaproteobacteria bacterium]|nr:IS256 family transposase [Deltaproteobacteria bacterium]
MSNKIIDINEGLIKEDRLCGAERYEHTDARKDTRAGHYERKLDTTSGRVTLKVPKLRKLPFETAIIERYRRRECSVEEALIEMYLAGVSVRRIEDITEALWGTKVSPSTISDLNKKAYGNIEKWRNRPLKSQYPYVYLDGICLKRSWGGEVRNVSILVANREIIGVAEGAKEDKEGWLSFLRSLKERGLQDAHLFISDKCLGLVESIHECFPGSCWQRCVVHFYRNVFSSVPNKMMKEVAAMLKAIHAQEDLESAQEKGVSVVKKLKGMRLKKAAEKVEESLHETLTYMSFPREHWTRIRTNNGLERLMREIRRRTRVVGSFPDGQSALMLAAARLRHVAGTKWSEKRYLNMSLLKDVEFIREKVA